MNYNTLLSGKNNPLKNQRERIDKRLLGGVMSRITQKVTASHPNAPELDLDAWEVVQWGRGLWIMWDYI